MHDRLARRVNLRHPIQDLPERDVNGIGDARIGVLIRLAHVYDLYVFAFIKSLFLLGHSNLFHE